LLLTTVNIKLCSARITGLRRALGNTRILLTIVTADLECGESAGDERGATTNVLSSRQAP
ncbi:MAG: hypothetical protein WCK86_24020, partial [Planctomycetia bacterium]